MPDHSATEAGRSYIANAEKQDLKVLRRISMRERILNAIRKKPQENARPRTKAQAVIDTATVGLATFEIARALSGTPASPISENPDIQRDAVQTVDERQNVNQSIVSEVKEPNSKHRIQRIFDGKLVIEFPSGDPQFVIRRDPYQGNTPNDYNGITGAEIQSINGETFKSSQDKVVLERPLIEMDKLTGKLYAVILVKEVEFDKPEIADVPIGDSENPIANFSGPGDLLVVRNVSNDKIDAEQGIAIRSFSLSEVNKTTVEANSKAGNT